jgi:hypothetical protein
MELERPPINSRRLLHFSAHAISRFSTLGVIPTRAAFQAKGGISLAINACGSNSTIQTDPRLPVIAATTLRLYPYNQFWLSYDSDPVWQP